MHRLQISQIVHNYGPPYHSPKLHPDPCSSVGVRPRTDRQTDTQTDARDHYTFRVVYTTHAKCNNNNKCTAVAETGDRLTTIGIDRKLGAIPFLGEWGPHLTQCGLGRGLPSFRTKWHLYPPNHLVTIDMGQKVRTISFLGGAGFPSNTMSHKPMHSTVPSGILIHPADWQQQT